MQPSFPHGRNGRGAIAGSASALALLLVFCAACAQERTGLDPRRIPAMQFQVDPTLLGPVCADSSLRIAFRPPRSFLPADTASHGAIRRQIVRERRPGDPLAADPVLLFAVPASSALCKVGRFLEPPVGGMSRAWIDRCRAELERVVAPSEVRWDLYRIGEEILAAQFLVSSPQMVLFRVLCQGPGPEPVMIDYLLPRDLYAAEVRAVEASIGSVEMF